MKQAHVSKYKKTVVAKFAKLLKEYPIVGAINMENMPAPQLQQMRQQLRKDVVILMNKRRLLKIAIENSKNHKKDIEKLVPYLKGMPALMFTKENPFKLYRAIKKNKSPAPAKPGQTAPKDIVVPAGPTPFVPGPIIGELGAIGIRTEVKAGKIAIKEDVVVVKEGKIITEKVAGMLTRLGIEPMEIGLDIVAVYEDGVIYDKKVLDVDETEFMNRIMRAAAEAINLAVESGYFSKDTIEVMITKATLESKAVAAEGNITYDEKNIAPANIEIVDADEAAPQKIEIVEEEKPKTAKEEIKEMKEIEKEVKKEIKEVKRDIKEMENHPTTDSVQRVEKEVKEVEKKMEKVREMKQPERKVNKDQREQAEQVERLYEELKKKGTLKNAEVNKPKQIDPLTPEDIIKQGQARMKKLQKEL